ncbi:MAG: hypothetical protein JSW61_12580 [Candidatus Thorarchaeota archaeon]|nr:MAG: hypothetical protein JSW61_12580 [Candidatus Thorarchaeota archaeon]
MTQRPRLYRYELLCGTISTLLCFMFFYWSANFLWLLAGTINALAVVCYGVRPWKSIFDKELSEEPEENF